MIAAVHASFRESVPEELLAYLPEPIDHDITIDGLFDRKIQRLEIESPTEVPDLKSVAGRVSRVIGRVRVFDARPSLFVALERYLSTEARGGRGYAASTVKRTRGALRTLFTEARILGLIDSNPVEVPTSLRVKRPRQIPDEIVAAQKALELDALGHLLARVDLHGDFGDYIVIALCALGGLRVGESIALTFDHVVEGPELYELIVEYSFHRKTGRVKLTTKSGVRRHVPVHPLLNAILAYAKTVWWPREFGRFPFPKDIIAPRHHESGKPIHRDDNRVLDHLRATCRKLRIREISVHDLRHTFVTQLRRAGVDGTIRRRLTHPPHPEDEHARYDHYDWSERCSAINKLRVPGLFAGITEEKEVSDGS